MFPWTMKKYILSKVYLVNHLVSRPSSKVCLNQLWVGFIIFWSLKIQSGQMQSPFSNRDTRRSEISVVWEIISNSIRNPKKEQYLAPTYLHITPIQEPLEGTIEDKSLRYTYYNHAYFLQTVLFQKWIGLDSQENSRSVSKSVPASTLLFTKIYEWYYLA